MKALITILALTMVAGLALADPVVVNFDDLEGSGPCEPGYGGIMSWNFWGHTTGNADYPALSDPQVGICVGDGSPIEFGQDVYVLGFSFTGPQPPIPVHFRLLRAGEVVFEILNFEPFATPFLFEVEYDGPVDQMVMDRPDGQPFGFFCIDDLTYDPNTVATETQTLSGVKALFE